MTRFAPATLRVQDCEGQVQTYHQADYSIDRFGKLVIAEDGQIKRIYNHDGWDWIERLEVVQ